MRVNKLFHLGRIAGIEPASSPWQREILPLDHIRIFFFVLDTQYVHTYMIYIYAWSIFVQCLAVDSIQVESNYFINLNLIFIFFSFKNKKFDPPF